MSIPNLYDTDMGDRSVDVSASTRKFQTSIIVKQDKNKSGVLSFLAQHEETTPQPPTRTAPQTVRPSRRQGGY